MSLISLLKSFWSWRDFGSAEQAMNDSSFQVMRMLGLEM
jgi:hypothetical protein